MMEISFIYCSLILAQGVTHNGTIQFIMKVMVTAYAVYFKISRN
jgi:hypothetical protein